MPTIAISAAYHPSPQLEGQPPFDPLPVSLLYLTVTVPVADTNLIFIEALPQVNKSSHTIILQCVTTNFYPVVYVFIVSRNRCVYKYPSLYPANRQHKQDLTPTPLYSHDMYPLFHRCKIKHRGLHIILYIIIINTNYLPTTLRVNPVSVKYDCQILKKSNHGYYPLSRHC